MDNIIQMKQDYESAMGSVLASRDSVDRGFCTHYTPEKRAGPAGDHPVYSGL